MTGYTAIIFFSSIIYNYALCDHEWSLYMTIISGTVILIASFLSGIGAKRLGRRPLLMFGAYSLGLLSIGFGK